VKTSEPSLVWAQLVEGSPEKSLSHQVMPKENSNHDSTNADGSNKHLLQRTFYFLALSVLTVSVPTPFVHSRG